MSKPFEKLKEYVDESGETWVKINTRFDGSCGECKDDIDEGDEVAWNKDAGYSLHLDCFHELYG